MSSDLSIQRSASAVEPALVINRILEAGVRKAPNQTITYNGRDYTYREFEERVHIEFATGDMPGFVHLSAGQEAVAAGVCSHLNNTDHIASTHRGHGHCIHPGRDDAQGCADRMGVQQRGAAQ